MKPATTRRKPAAQSEPNTQPQSNKTMPNDERPNMRVMEIFERSASDHSLEPLDQAELTALEAILFEKNDRLYFRCPVRNKDILAKPEKAVRQLWILRLTKHYGYPINRLAVEYPITFGRDTSKRADIVIFDADRPTVPYTIVEVKQTKLKDGKEQLRSYTHATGAPIALWSNGAQTHGRLARPCANHRRRARCVRGMVRRSVRRTVRAVPMI